jgi:hypothetical protein
MTTYKTVEMEVNRIRLEINEETKSMTLKQKNQLYLK